MHIAQVAPLTEAIPPKLYGGTERVVSWLTEELIALGHEITLFASGDSITSARLEAMWPRALRLDGSVRDPNALHMMMLERVYQRAADFDFLHFHLDYYPFSLFARQPTPFIDVYKRQVLDKVAARRERRIEHLFVGGLRPAIADVFHDRTVEQRNVLRHHADGFSQAVLRNARDVDCRPLRTRTASQRRWARILSLIHISSPKPCPGCSSEGVPIRTFGPR